jgi:hypothetical protein
MNPEIVKHLSALRNEYIRDILQDCYVEDMKKAGIKLLKSAKRVARC